MSDHCPRAIHIAQAREKPTYIAGPLTSSDLATELLNADKAYQVAIDLIRAGHLVYVPHLCRYLDQVDEGNLGWQFWMDYDLEWLRHCGRLVRIPGESNGADLEVAEALSIGMRVYFWDDAEDWQELRTMFVRPDVGEQLAAGSGSLT